MMPKSTQETDPLIKSLIPSPRTPWKKRSAALITIVLVLLILYLIISSLSPSLPRFNSKKNIISNNNQHMVGTDPFIDWEQCDSIQSPPDLIAFHIHAAFDGNDENEVSFAYKTYHDFIQYTNPSMQACTFAHSTAPLTQTEVCYFPTTWTETDVPIPSNFIFQSANYAFYIPPNTLQKSMTFWMQYHNDLHYVIHSVSGCQYNDHTKWLVASAGYDATNLITDNLLCCHHGPAMCTCGIVQYQLNEDNECLGIEFDDNNEVLFVRNECESASNRNVGSWRELMYNDEQNWYQIENYGDIDHPMYLCLGVADDKYCDIEAEIELMDCSYQQDVDNDMWISPSTQFIYDKDSNQIRLLGCNDANDLCVKVVNEESDIRQDIVKLSVGLCQDSTVFIQRHFFP